MTCHSWANALMDAAVGGAPIEPELAAHLDECAACRAALESTHAVLLRIDGELAAGLDVEPEENFLGRVRAALVPPAERSWRAGLLLPAGLAAAIVWSFVAVHHDEVPEEIRAAAPLQATARPQPQDAGAGGIAVPAVRAEAAPRPAHTLRAHPTHPLPPEVLVAADQAEALRGLAESSRGRRVDASGLLVPGGVVGWARRARSRRRPSPIRPCSPPPPAH
jgi:hypothetical protein